MKKVLVFFVGFLCSLPAHAITWTVGGVLGFTDPYQVNLSNTFVAKSGPGVAALWILKRRN